MSTQQMSVYPDHAKVRIPHEPPRQNHHDPPEAALLVKDLCWVETYLGKKGASAFVYEEELDVFRFDNARFAFCKEFADWSLLRERGYLDL